MHPHAFPGNKSGGNSGTASEVHSGDRIIYDIDQKRGVLDECLPDGDAYVTWDDGTYGTVKWNHLSPEPKPKDDPFGRQLQPVRVVVSGGEKIDRSYWAGKLRTMLEHQSCCTNHRITKVDEEAFTIYPDANND